MSIEKFSKARFDVLKMFWVISTDGYITLHISSLICLDTFHILNDDFQN